MYWWPLRCHGRLLDDVDRATGVHDDPAIRPTTTSSGPTATTSGSSAPATDLPVTDAIRAQLVASAAGLNNIPVAEFTGLAPGLTYYALDRETNIYWAAARLVAAPTSDPSSPSRAQVSTQDDGSYYLFQQPQGGPWTAYVGRKCRSVHTLSGHRPAGGGRGLGMAGGELPATAGSERREKSRSNLRPPPKEEQPMPEFPTITHVALTVSDLSDSVPWYERLFGCKPVLDEDTGPFRHVVWLLGRPDAGRTPSVPRPRRRLHRSTNVDWVWTIWRSPAPTTVSSSSGKVDRTSSASTNGGIVDAPYGSGLSFRDPDNIALEFFAPPT